MSSYKNNIYTLLCENENYLLNIYMLREIFSRYCRDSS